MILFDQSAFLQALGWALLSSLWQYGLLWMIYVIYSSIFSNQSSRVRHTAALLLTTLGGVWFIAGIVSRYILDENAIAYPEVPVYNSRYAGVYLSVRNTLESYMAYVSGIYLIVVAGLSVKFIKYFKYSYTIKSKGLTKLNAELRLYVQQLVQQFEIRRKVQVWMSEYIDTPMVIGIIKPTILIPFACMNYLSVKQMEAVLLHELAHIKRNDYLINLYAATLETLFFFNPFTRILLQSLKRERENSCDDVVIQFRFDRHQYASALLTLEKNRSSSYPLSVAATGDKGILLHRIRRIMNVQSSGNKNMLSYPGGVLPLLLLAFVAFIHPKNNISNYNNVSPIITPNIINDHRPNLIRNITTVPKTVKPTSKTVAGDNKQFVSETDSFSLLLTNNLNSYVFVDHKINNTTDAVVALKTVKEDQAAFSLPETDQPQLPAAAIVEQFPFVPRSSFSQSTIEDTSKPISEVETYQQRLASESLAKAQKAIESLNWKKIEKMLDSKADIKKLREEIQSSLLHLNWQKINEEVKESLNKNVTEKMRTTLKAQVQEVDNYKNLLQEYQKIHEELQQQQEDLKQQAEIKSLQIDKQARKKKTIVII